jgi:hypothetical protein
MVVDGAAGADVEPYRVDRFDGLSDDELRAGAKARYLGRHPSAAAVER